jgi:hypothetical protein
MDNKEHQIDDIVDEEVVDGDVVNTTDTPEEIEHRADERSVRNEDPVMEEGLAPLFEHEETEEFRSHWLDVQSRFVDDPREAVKKADELVEEVINSITNSFSQKRTSLENHWSSGDNVSTEDLRLAIQRYRSFFNRLLSLES